MRIFGILFISLLMASCSGEAQNTATEKDQTTDQISRIDNPKEFKKELESNENYYLIDVRTPREYQGGTIMQAENLNLTDGTFENAIDTLDKNKAVYVFCQSGRRSGKAAEILKKEGFKEIIDLKGGFTNWQNVKP